VDTVDEYGVGSAANFPGLAVGCGRGQTECFGNEIVRRAVVVSGVADIGIAELKSTAV
jgi:hypothetical protein